MDYDDIPKQAMALGEKRHPDALDEHHGAFANSVAYLVTGMSGGYGGPSMREHAASRVGHTAGLVGTCTFDEAVVAVEEVCYGPLTLAIAEMFEEENCFDDATSEIAAAKELLRRRPRPENN